MILAAAVVVLEVAGCLGLGAALLVLLGVSGRLAWGERAAVSFAAGMGVLGWLMFFFGVLGLFQPWPLAALLAAGALGCLFLGRPPAPGVGWPAGVAAPVLLALFAVAVAFDLAEALSPPADGDSLAYHFTLPKQFLAAGRLEFVPRAFDGAVPLLVQMTYVAPLALGGEAALTLWTFASGWALAVLFYVACRRHLDVASSLAATLVLMTAPALVYGAGAGQVEARIASFALLAGLAGSRALGERHLGFAALAGAAAGFYMGSKVLGLFFAAACGLVMLAGRGRLARAALFGLCALVAGGQWYAWNTVHAGDPFFPLLFGWLDYADRGYWDAAHAEYLRQGFFAEEQAVARTPWWLLLYPVAATLGAVAQVDAARVGLGPYPLLVLPFAFAGAWRFRERIRRSPLTPMVAIAVLFYALWFFVGSSQRLRHLLPVLPLVMLPLTVAARRWCAGPARMRPLAAAFAFTIALQMAGHGLFSLNYLRHVLTGESRDAFLARNIGEYPAVRWINANLGPGDRVYLEHRYLNYLIEVPIHYGAIGGDALVDILPSAADPGRYFRQLKARGVTHLLVTVPAGRPARLAGRNLWIALIDRGCAEVVRDFDVVPRGSRTLPTLSGATARFNVVRLAQTCPR